MNEDEGLMKNIKSFIFKNHFVLVFSILTIIGLLVSLSSFFKLNLYFSILVTFVGLFTPTIWVLLTVSFLFSVILSYYEKYHLLFLILLVFILITTIAIRTSNISDLRNAATGDYELGPDLDPHLFLRQAGEILEGKNMGELDVMRYAPLGADNFIYDNFMSWAIVAVYKFINLFGDYSLTYAAIISPVIFFSISIIGFFLFCYVVFLYEFTKERSLMLATIVAFIYSISPQLIHRTTAGIPELESLGMMFYWFAFLFFALAWKQKNVKLQITYGLLAGLFTALMTYSWGGYKYIYMTLGLASFLFFFLSIEKRKNAIIFSSFLLPAILARYLKVSSLKTVLFGLNDTGLGLAILFFILLDLILFSPKIKHKLRLNKINFPESLITLVIGFLIILFSLLIINPSMVYNSISQIIQALLYPFGNSRIGLTIAENKAPYFVDIFESFRYLFWLFFFGVIVLFYEAIKHFELKNKILLNVFFIIFLSSFIFSRMSPNHQILTGDNFISQALYLGGLIVFGVVLVWLFIKGHTQKERRVLDDFKKVGFLSILLISFAFWAIISMRGAVRLFFIITPTLILLSSYLVVKLFDYSRSKDKLVKLFFLSLFILVILILVNISISYTLSSTNEAKYTIPSSYNQQWHKAMYWVSENTPENSIFTHWWDYGYWVQTLGKRPTVSDGGHFNNWWDHTVGRYILTTPYPETALSMMKTHNVSYLLIDSTDLGKYSAFSSIGSDETGKDRLSWIPILVSDPKQIQETSSGIIRIYQGSGSYLDDNIIYDMNGTSIYLSQNRDAMVGIILEYSEENGVRSMKQAKGVFYVNKQRVDIPIRYIYFNGKMTDFGSGLNNVVRIIPSIVQSQSGIQVDPLGAVIYLSEKTTNSLFAQLYLMDDPFNNYPTISLAHSQDDYVIETLSQQGANFGEFVYYQGFRGPIKIWKVDYPKNTLIREEFLWNISPEGKWGALDDLDFVSKK